MLQGIAEGPWVVFVERPAGFRGELSASGLVELVQAIAITTPTGALHLESAAGAGTLWFDAGAIVHAVFGNERGASAFQRMLQWRTGSFRVDARACPPERSIALSTTQLLLESAHIFDEQNANSIRDGAQECAAE